jgi:hypothetical protein
MTCRNRRNVGRVTIAAETLDDILTEELHRVPGFEAVAVSAGYRLRAPDVQGCNWSGRVVPLHGVRAPPAAAIAAALTPIVRLARERYNISE